MAASIYISYRCIGHIARTKQNNKKAGFPFVGLAHDPTLSQKNTSKHVNVKRGIVKQRSYFSTFADPVRTL